MRIGGNVRFRGSDIFSSACVTSATRTYIYRRLPLEASHCVLEYVLRLPGTSNAQDIFRYIIFARLYRDATFFNFHERNRARTLSPSLSLSLSHSLALSASILLARIAAISILIQDPHPRERKKINKSWTRMR